MNSIRNFITMLRPGDRVLIRFARRSTCVAQVIEPWNGSRLRVRRWSSAGHRWSSPVSIPGTDVIRNAHPGEVSFLPKVDGAA